MSKNVMLGHGKFRISVDARKFDDAARAKVDKFLKNTDAKVQSGMKRISGHLRRGFAFGTAGAGIAGAALLGLGKSFALAGERAATANARTRQVATSMGLFGDKTEHVVGRLTKLAEATARQTGVDTDAIKLTQAKLMTFGELAKSADTVGGSFDRATMAAVDMAAAGFGSASDNAVQLGKALQDPIKGVNALSRNGITFTAAEKEKISTLVKSQRAHEAQAFILSAVEKQTKGTATATADASAKIRVSLEQSKQKIGLWLLPMWERTADWISRVGIPKMESFGRYVADAFTRHKPKIDAFIRLLSDVKARIVGMVTWVLANRGWIMPLVAGIGTFTLGIKAYSAAVTISRNITALWAARTKLMAGAQLLLNMALKANPVGLVIGLVAGLVAALVTAYHTSDKFRAVVNRAFAVVVAAAKNVAAWFMRLGASIVQLYKEYIAPIVRRVVDAFKTWLLPAISFVIKAIVAYYKAWWAALQTAWNVVGRPVFAAIIAGVGRVKEWVQTYIGAVILTWRTLWNTLTALWSEHGQPLVARFISAWDRAKQGFSGFVSHVKRSWTEIQRSAIKPVNFLIGTVINKGIIDNYNRLAKLFGAKTVGHLSTISAPSRRRDKKINFGRGLQAFAEGGPIVGPGTGTSDSILAKVSNGEYVVKARQTAKYFNLIEAINNDTVAKQFGPEANSLPAYRDGGIVRAQQWARAQAGKPYIWAGVGPRGYDCSGAVSALINVLHGRYPHRRLFATGSIPRYFIPGRGALTIGVDKPGEKHRIGHTAASIGGMRIESRGSRGFLVGSSARSPMSFNHQYTIPGFGGAYSGDTGGDWGLPDPKSWIKQKLSGLGDSAAFGNILKSVADKLADKAIESLKNLNDVFDDGGVAHGIGWMPKATLEPERVLSPRQTVAFDRLVASLERNELYDGPRETTVVNNYEIHIYEADDAESTAEAVIAELSRRA